MFFELAIRILGRNAKHSANTIIGIGLVIAMIVSIFGIISGFSTEIGDLTSQIQEGNTIMIREEGKTLVESRIPLHIVDFCYIDNVEFVIPQRVLTTRVSHSDNNSEMSFDVTFWGINTSMFFDSRPSSFISSGAISNYNDTILLGNNFLLQMNQSIPLELNITNHNNLNKINITAEGAFFDPKQYNNGIIGPEWITYQLDPGLKDFYTFIEIIVSSEASVSKILYSLNKLLEREGNFVVEVVQKNQEFLIQMFQEIITKFDYFAFALYIIVLIKVFHSLIWLLTKHEYDFILLKALGASDYQISVITFFLTEIIGNFSVFCGVLLGVSFPQFIVGFMTLFFNMSPVFFVITTEQLVSVILLSNVMIIIASIWPIYNSSRKSIHGFQTMNEI